MREQTIREGEVTWCSFLTCNRKFLFEKVGFGPEKDRFCFITPCLLRSIFRCLSEATFHTMLVRDNFSYYACWMQLF